MFKSAQDIPESLSIFAVLFVVGCAASAPLNGGMSAGASVIGSGAQRGDALSGVPEFKAAQRFTVSVPLADAWTRLARAYSDLGIPLTTVNAKDHLLGNEGMRRSHTLANSRLSSFMDCGSGGSGGANADVYSVNMSVMSRVSALTDSTTEVVTLLQATARPMSFGTDPIVCGTTGSLEARISSMVSGAAPKQ